MVFLRRLTFALSVVAALLAVLMYLRVSETDRLLDSLIARSTRDVSREDVDATVLAMSQAIYDRTKNSLRPEQLPWLERLEATSYFNVGTGLALKYGFYGVVGHDVFGPCGTMTRVLLNACWRIGIPARKLQLLPGARDPGGHTMVEFRSGDRWLVISPSDSSFVWRLPDGRIATREEIRGDSTVFAQVFDRYPRYPYRFDHPSNIRWEKLPGPVRTAFRTVLGEHGYAEAETPRLYDQPRRLVLYLALAALGMGLIGFALSRRIKRPLGA